MCWLCDKYQYCQHEGTAIDIADQHQEQQEAKQLPGKISSYCLLMGIIFTEESLPIPTYSF
jgi:hypothetical protein